MPLKGTESTLSDLALDLLLLGLGVLGGRGGACGGPRGAGVRSTGSPRRSSTWPDGRPERRHPGDADAEDEIARLSRSFNSMTVSLASSRELQQQLIAGDELRTPLTSLRTNIELLTRSEETGRPLPDADRKALLASVKAQITELAALIGDLQELSRPTRQHTGRTRILAWQDIAESALRLRPPARPGAHHHGGRRTLVRTGRRPAPERAVVNILDNAVKFSPEGGVIDVRLTEGTLTVRDHGPGISPAELPHALLHCFWRSESARSLPGSGLGLSIVARTVQQSGGEVTLAPAAGGRTVATIRLPGAPVPPPGNPRPGRPPSALTPNPFEKRPPGPGPEHRRRPRPRPCCPAPARRSGRRRHLDAVVVTAVAVAGLPPGDEGVGHEVCSSSTSLMNVSDSGGGSARSRSRS
ncbi:Adaptive-response sensory-kinase SasA [Streptomyces cyaneofuscatus]